MLTEKELFKVGFLRKCADAGLTAEETAEVVKQALHTVKTADLTKLIEAPYQAGLDIVSNTGKSLGNLGLGAALFGPALLGGAAGYGLSRLTDVDDTDVSAIKQQELIDEYRRQTELLRGSRRGVFKRPHVQG
jgi:hypothetical protein